MTLKDWKRYWKIILQTFKEFNEQHAVNYSASIAFYTVFSLPGILLIVVRTTGIFFGEELVEGKLEGKIQKIVSPEAAKEVESILHNAHISDTSPLMTIIGVSILTFSATTVFTIIQQALNHIWSVRPKPRKGWLKLIWDRALSFLMVIILGALMLISVLADLFIVVFRGLIDKFLPGSFGFIITGITFLFSFIVMFLIFGLIFMVLPDARLRWRDVTIGTFITTLLFTLGKYLIGFYLGTSTLNTTYGAAGSLILILLWVNYSAMIMLFGAVFTQVYSRFSGRRIRPSSNAVKLELREIEKDSAE